VAENRGPHKARFWLRGVEFGLLDGVERY